MTGNQDTFHKAMNQGHSAAWDQQWETAAGFYRQALQEFPLHPKALSSLGLALLELHQEQEALMAYYQVTKITPEDPVPVEKVAQICEKLNRPADVVVASLRAAELYLKKNDLQRAVANWQRAARLEPENLQAHSRLAVVYERQGRKVDAVAEYLQAAALVQRQGDFAKAAQAVAHALQVLPESTEARQAWNRLKTGEILPLQAKSEPAGRSVPRSAASAVESITKRRRREAQSAAASRRVAHGPQNPVNEAAQVAINELAGVLFEQSEEVRESMEAARRNLDAIVSGEGGLSPEQAGRSQTLLQLGKALDAQTQVQDDQAVEALERAIGLGLNLPAAEYNLGLLYFTAGRLEDAVPRLQKVLQTPAYNLAGRLILGQAERKLGHTRDAAVHYMEALKLADAHVVLPAQAEELRQLYEPLIETVGRETDEKALAGLCQSIDGQLMDPHWRDELTRSRRSLPEQPAGSPPLPLAEMLLTVGSSQVIESLAEVRRLTKAGLPGSAVETAYIALGAAPAYLPLHTQIGELLLEGDRPQDALDKFLITARTYEVRGEAAQAVNLYRRVIQLSPMNLDARDHLISLLAQQKRCDEALKEYMDLASLHYRIGDLDKSRQVYEKALDLSGGSEDMQKWAPVILSRMGDIDTQRLDWRQALADYQKVRDLQPADEKTRTNLIDLNYRLNRSPAVLEELVDYALQLENLGQQEALLKFTAGLLQEHDEHAELHAFYADHLRAAGRLKEAAAEYDRAGDLYMAQGNSSAAAGVIETIIGLNPPNAAEYQRLLEKIKAS